MFEKEEIYMTPSTDRSIQISLVTTNTCVNDNCENNLPCQLLATGQINVHAHIGESWLLDWIHLGYANDIIVIGDNLDRFTTIHDGYFSMDTVTELKEKVASGKYIVVSKEPLDISTTPFNLGKQLIGQIIVQNRCDDSMQCLVLNPYEIHCVKESVSTRIQLTNLTDEQLNGIIEYCKTICPPTDIEI